MVAAKLATMQSLKNYLLCCAFPLAVGAGSNTEISLEGLTKSDFRVVADSTKEGYT
jgi:hypothetical protein